MTKFSIQLLALTSAVSMAVTIPQPAQAGLLDYFRWGQSTQSQNTTTKTITYKFTNGQKLTVTVGLADSSLDKITFVGTDGQVRTLPGIGPITYLELPNGVDLKVNRPLNIGAKKLKETEPVFAIGWGKKVFAIHETGTVVSYRVDMSNSSARMASTHFNRKHKVFAANGSFTVKKHTFEVRAFDVPNGPERIQSTFVAEFDPSPELIDETIRAVQISGLYAPDAGKDKPKAQNNLDADNHPPGNQVETPKGSGAKFVEFDNSGIFIDPQQLADDTLTIKGIARSVDIRREDRTVVDSKTGKAVIASKVNAFRWELRYTTSGTGLPVKPQGVEKSAMMTNQSMKLETALEKITEFTQNVKSESLPDVNLTPTQQEEIYNLGLKISTGGKPIAYVGPLGGNMGSMVLFATELFPRTWIVREMTKANAKGGQGIVGDVENIIKMIARATNDVPIVLFLPNLTEWATFGDGMTAQNFFSQFSPDVLRRMRIVGIANEQWAEMFPGTNAAFEQINWKKPQRNEWIQALRNEMAKEESAYPMSITPELIEKIIMVSDRIDARQEAPGRYLDVLREVARITLKERNPTEADVDAALKSQYPFAPRALRDPTHIAETEKHFRETFARELPGQDALVDDLWIQVRMWLAGETSGRGPNASILFVSVPGIGKTKTAEVLAQALDMPLKRVNLGLYTNPADANKALSDTSDKVDEAKGNAIVLMDEVNNAHLSVQGAFLPAFDNEYYDRMPKGTAAQQQATMLRATLRGTLVIWAGNAGMKLLKQRAKQGITNQTKRPSLIDRELADHLEDEGLVLPALISRMTMVAGMYPTTESEFRNVLTTSVQKALELSAKTRRQFFNITNLKEFINSVISNKYYPGISNREGKSIADQYVKDTIAIFRSHMAPDKFDAPGNYNITLPVLENPCHSYMEFLK